MATANSTPARNILAEDCLDEARDALRAIQAVEILIHGDDVPTREDLGCLFTVLHDAVNTKLSALAMALKG